MQILPVIDLLGGVVVRGVAGRRDEYRPIESPLVSRPDPLHVAETFREKFGLTELYVADLDAILHGRPNFSVYEELAATRFRLMIDAGLRDLPSAREVLRAGASAVIAGLETIPGPDFLADLCTQLGTERVVFSLDLRNGSPLGDLAPWRTEEPFEIARRAMHVGIRRLIVLDLAAVGVSGGTPTEPLCRRILDEFLLASGGSDSPRGLPSAHDVRTSQICSEPFQLITGGGIRHADDLAHLASLGLHGVLVASTLHDGRLAANDVRRFSDTMRKS